MELKEDVMTAIITLGSLALILTVGGFIADHIFPRIPAIERFLDSFEQ